MTSFKQFEANRRNALKSTGPTSSEGKQRSRCNAVRHGLTAETVIGALEDAEDYVAFEAAIIADYEAQSAVERDLVLRLASLLWRLRRATTMETGLFEIQAEHSSGIRQPRQIQSEPGEWSVQSSWEQLQSRQGGVTGCGPESIVNSTIQFGRCFLRLANLPDLAFDRVSRYEARLWRQVRQVVFMLEVLDRRKPQERRHGYSSSAFRWPASMPFEVETT